MNRDAMEKWVGALENGDYKQYYGRLRVVTADGIRVCALGVGYEVLAQELGIKEWIYDHEMGPKFFDWLGFDTPLDLVVTDPRGNRTNVPFLNDHDKLTFPEIAQLLRKEYL